MDTKSCARCGCIKLLPEFHANGMTDDGYQHACKQCVARRRHYPPIVAALPADRIAAYVVEAHKAKTLSRIKSIRGRK